MASEPISIVIPAFNQLAYCRQCIESLVRNTRRAYRLILVDNGSTDGVGEYFDSVTDATALHAGRNLGFPAGTNLGLKRATGHVVVLNSDTVVSEGWLTQLETALLSEDDFGMAGPMSNQAGGAQQIDGLALHTPAEIDAFALQLAQQRPGAVRTCHRLVGFCLMVRGDVLAKVGLLDEAFGIGNFEDDDYCFRVRQAGYRLAVAEDCFVFHHGGRTFEGMGLAGDEFNALLARNRQRYMDKWDVHVAEPAAPEKKSLALNARAHEALAQQRPTDAMRLLKDAIAACPTLPRNYEDLAAILQQLGKPQLAQDFLKQAQRATEKL